MPKPKETKMGTHIIEGFMFFTKKQMAKHIIDVNMKSQKLIAKMTNLSS